MKRIRRTHTVVESWYGGGHIKIIYQTPMGKTKKQPFLWLWYTVPNFLNFCVAKSYFWCHKWGGKGGSVTDLTLFLIFFPRPILLSRLVHIFIYISEWWKQRLLLLISSFHGLMAEWLYLSFFVCRSSSRYGNIRPNLHFYRYIYRHKSPILDQ